ncbi:MAG: phosphatase PAP2 family protein [Deltaproteobacteria bacterium]|nr:phosphatase PAP2 family protein [Deltaproteobacteria bacterium]
MALSLALFFFSGANSSADTATYRPLDHLWWGTRDLAETPSLVVLGAGTALTVVALTLDTGVHDYFAGHDRLGGAARIGNDYIGTGIPGAILAAGTLGFGLWRDRQHEIDSGEAQLEGLVATGAYTELLKFTVRRARPDSGNLQSFPSGHTSIAFSSAASLMELHGPSLGVPALVLAAFTGVCRLDVNAHHLSDVIFGAALGYAVGQSYALHHQCMGGQRRVAPAAQCESQGQAAQVALLPYFDGRSDFGVAARLKF